MALATAGALYESELRPATRNTVPIWMSYSELPCNPVMVCEVLVALAVSQALGYASSVVNLDRYRNDFGVIPLGADQERVISPNSGPGVAVTPVGGGTAPACADALAVALDPPLACTRKYRSYHSPASNPLIVNGEVEPAEVHDPWNDAAEVSLMRYCRAVIVVPVGSVHEIWILPGVVPWVAAKSFGVEAAADVADALAGALYDGPVPSTVRTWKS